MIKGKIATHAAAAAPFLSLIHIYPILWAADESYYLKFYIFQVCEEL